MKIDAQTQTQNGIRAMTKDDVAAVMSLMKPFVESGKLLPRTEEKLLSTFGDYVVYELDGEIRACVLLHIYPDGQAEIGALAVDQNFANIGIGENLVNYLLEKAKNLNAKSVFALTTQAGDWFQKLGFTPSTVESLPPERRAIWTPERNSKVYRKI